MRKTLHPPPQTTPTFEIQNQNKGIEDIMYIDSNWGTFQYFYNVENSIKREMRKNCFSKKKKSTPPPPPPPPPRIFFFKCGNSMKREENLKY